MSTRAKLAARCGRNSQSSQVQGMWRGVESITMEEAMSLSREDKEALHQAILRLARTIQDLEPSAVDPRVLDMLEICGSLIEQQIDLDIIFELSDEEPGYEVILKEDGEAPEQEHEVVHIKFEEDKNIPSAEDLETWFNIGD